eukprot:TRINITY_DN18879_c0_g1_i1.p1 TRINITY_DN18879_c0_g1~~TRINITY_DN18879_c0_g1_i1.p1  ORF type:complete len:148 (+),score=3.84 TRINITY_DN18879_c0_g1_i1:56-499(+)
MLRSLLNLFLFGVLLRMSLNQNYVRVIPEGQAIVLDGNPRVYLRNTDFQGKGVNSQKFVLTGWIKFRSTFSTGGSAHTILSLSNFDYSSQARGTLSWLVNDSRFIYIEASRTAGLVSLTGIAIATPPSNTNNVLVCLLYTSPSPRDS